MNWLGFLLSFLIPFCAALAGSLLVSTGKKRNQPSREAARIEALLPGHDCGFCGFPTCREYAAAIEAARADPTLCSPGGMDSENSIRAFLAERRNGDRAARRRAVVLCGGRKGVAAAAFDYDNREDCASAAAVYGGPRACKDGCLGFGSCLAACPLGAIAMDEGCAVIDAGRCTGCGACLEACPKGLIALIPAEQAWYVACSARVEPERRMSMCSAACDACGDCARRSMMGEFVISNRIAKVVRIQEPLASEIAARCHSSAIRGADAKKRTDTPSGSQEPGL